MTQEEKLRFCDRFAEEHKINPLSVLSMVEELENDPQIEKHLDRVKEIQSILKAKVEERELLAKVFLRRTGALPNPTFKGSFIIEEDDLISWFKNGDHLKTYTSYDLL